MVIRRERTQENRRRTIILEDPDLEREIQEEQGRRAPARQTVQEEMRAAGGKSDAEAVN